MSQLNQLFIWIFEQLKSVVELFVADPGNQWGITIVFFTILFNILMLPVNLSQMKTMRKQQALQPEVAKLQAKYKNDPQKMQEMQMKLYKENNVSMFGGCLPLLITYPIFIAMFSVFRQLAADGKLTGMRFTPLIPDLSANNNIILAALSVGTMLLSTYITTMRTKTADNPAAASANKMQYMMAVLFGWITYTSNSALGLYWITGNLFRMIQGLILNAVEKKKEEQVIK
ncbi:MULTISPECIES: YidC/Oxa1 family membrane protein insertase [Proteiniclasticum]|uniref:YidC/Oxa1 family membrane protein insertase n=1 Tax=Proteiniclasticum ruminis TaxID=398199 RepID=A0A1I5EKB1_9CLOT|nr:MULTISPECIES: YidC/Oxa1 family membrane protein insertase [Proteiniclasticum]SFO11786.1 YidC/Oxa1 family membrane protein insertase [Proteiniclasticum ruminis]